MCPAKKICGITPSAETESTNSYYVGRLNKLNRDLHLQKFLFYAENTDKYIHLC